MMTKNQTMRLGPAWLRWGALAVVPALVMLAACTSAAIKPQTASAAATASSTDSTAQVPGEITHIDVHPVRGHACKRAPVTFGQPFAKGDLAAGQSLKAVYHGQPLPIQTNIKAHNRDGSARHAVVTIIAPCDGGRVALVATSAPARSRKPLTLREVLSSNFDTKLSVDIHGHRWRLDARRLLSEVAASGGCKAAKIHCRRWLRGDLASEWVVGAPLQDAAGDKHPHLAAYFAVRAYGPAPVERVRVDVIVENDWAYVPDPTNISYDARIRVAQGKPIAFKSIRHYRQARWHQALWWGANDAAPLYPQLDPSYLQSTPAVPSYENITISPKLLSSVRQNCAPMKPCDITPHMENTGAQPQIGPLPEWSSAYVVDTDYRLYNWMLANADAMGAYGIHYREKSTGNPLAIADHPCVTTLGPAKMSHCPKGSRDFKNLPDCNSGHCHSPLHAEESHHPAPAYVAYLVTGDWYYKTEMSFWGDWVVFWQNPRYRDYATGLTNRTQTRGQAWGLRTLGDVAYLLPDDAPLKSYFNHVVAANIAWYNAHYTHNPKANDLGAISNYHAVIYPSNGHARTGIATWQQSFFDWAVGNLVDQGFKGAPAFRDWVSQFPVGLMTAPGYCWPLASAYHVRIRDSRHSPFYDSFAEVYRKSFPKLVDAGCGADALNRALIDTEGKKHFHYPPNTMVGYPSSPTGFPANFQVGLASAANSDLPDAARAWSIFAKRSVQPDYGKAPQFAVVPTNNPAASSSR